MVFRTPRNVQPERLRQREKQQTSDGLESRTPRPPNITLQDVTPIFLGPLFFLLAGGKDPSRHNEACQVTTFRPADVKSVCEKFTASQTDFPLMLGVSVATLHFENRDNAYRMARRSHSCVSSRATPERPDQPVSATRRERRWQGRVLSN
jgi:hypothetical protein